MLVAFVLPSLNNLNLRWVQCEVTGAYAQRSDNHRVHPWRVNLETRDCGVVSYRAGITSDNAGDVASAFEPGRYKFELGLVSQ